MTNLSGNRIAVQFIGSGSKGNAAILRAGTRTYLLDAGLGGRVILRHLQSENIDPAELSGIFISHGHGDHVKGLGTLLKKTSAPVFCTRGTHQELPSGLPQFTPFFLTPGREVELNDLRVWPFRVPHDSREPIGLRFEHDGCSLAVATDLGHISPEAFIHLVDCDILCLESNYDEDMLAACTYPGWLKSRIRGPNGHLSNNGIRGILSRHSRLPSHVLLVHLSQESNTPELVRKTLQTLLLGNRHLSFPSTIARQDVPTRWIAA